MDFLIRLAVFVIEWIFSSSDLHFVQLAQDSNFMTVRGSVTLSSYAAEFGSLDALLSLPTSSFLLLICIHEQLYTKILL